MSTTSRAIASTGRVEALSDGVFAVAITLLVLELKVTEQDAEGGLWHALGRLWPSYLAYAVSFAMIGIMWVNHHAIFSRLALVDRSLMYANLALLAVVSFVPFPTAIVADFIRDDRNARAAAMFYGGVGVALGLAFTLMWGHISHHDDLLKPGLTNQGARRQYRQSAMGMCSYFIGIAVASVSPIAALAVYGALGLFFAITSAHEPLDLTLGVSDQAPTAA